MASERPDTFGANGTLEVGTDVFLGLYLLATVVLFGLVPRAAVSAWGLLGACALVSVLGPLLGLGFILFLPIAVPVVLLYGIGKKISGAMHGRRPVAFNHKPGGVR